MYWRSLMTRRPLLAPLAPLLLLFASCQPAAEGRPTTSSLDATKPSAIQSLFPLATYSRLVGTKAPEIDIGHWLNADATGVTPFKTFAPGKVTVLVFWASWCPNCTAALPLLADLQAQYAPRGVTIVGVSHEDADDVRTFLAAAAKQPDAPAKRLCLSADPDNSVHAAYMETVDETAIPTAFIVGKEGLVEWIGHPSDLESPLRLVVEDGWDRAAFIAERKSLEPIRARVAGIMDDQQAGKTAAATAALKVYAAESRQDAGTLNEIAWLTFDMAGGKPLPDAFLAEAIAAADAAIALEPNNANFLDTLAHLQALKGDLAAAIAAQKRAVEHGGAERFGDYLRELESHAK
jgi:thiol-disulfide isomerase/thioredoxin